MNAGADGLLLDTCALVWLANREPLREAARRAILDAQVAGTLHVSVVSAWEVGLLARKGRLDFRPDPSAWFARALGMRGARLAPLVPEAAVAAPWLPDRADGTALHGDPGDRLLIATARALGVPLVTRDARILAYAAEGQVAAIAC